jgi:hypothetical protein
MIIQRLTNIARNQTNNYHDPLQIKGIIENLKGIACQLNTRLELQININEINKSFFKSHSVDLLLFLNSVRNKLLNNTFISIDNHPTAFIDDNIFNIEESVIRVAFSVKKIDEIIHQLHRVQTKNGDKKAQLIQQTKFFNNLREKLSNQSRYLQGLNYNNSNHEDTDSEFSEEEAQLIQV